VIIFFKFRMEAELLCLVYDYLLSNSFSTAAAAFKKSCMTKRISVVASDQTCKLSEVFTSWAARSAAPAPSEGPLAAKKAVASENIRKKTDDVPPKSGKKKKSCEKSAQRPVVEKAVSKNTESKTDDVPPKSGKKKRSRQESAQRPIKKLAVETPAKKSAEGVAQVKSAPVVQSAADLRAIADSGGSNMKLGQWQTASLDSQQRENKFFRLLGGAKAGGVGSPQASDNKKAGLFKSLSGKCGNAAMAKEQQESFFKTLENQFESARNLGLQNKGGGLGFHKDPAEGKKFHIDTGVKKSKSFDD